MENFQLKIFELVEKGDLKKGDLANLDIKHDDWCQRLMGTGGCNCNPCITVYKSETPEDWVGTYFALRNSYRKH